MKKCFFCAEKIQDNAIKCKHCGEWVSTQTNKADKVSGEWRSTELLKRCYDCGLEISKEAFAESSDICNTCAEKNLKAKTSTTTNDRKYWTLPLFKGHGKYGKGWIIFLFVLGGVYKNLNSNGSPFSDVEASVLWTLLYLPFMILYFGLRRKFIKIWEYERWKPGIIAGFATFLLVIITFNAIVYFDTKSITSKKALLFTKYSSEIKSFKQEDVSYLSRLITKPTNRSDIEKNMKLLDEYSEYFLKNKHEFINKMLNDYKITLVKKRNVKSNRYFSDIIKQMLSIYDTYQEKERIAITLLKDYYISGNKKYYQEYIAAVKEADQLKVEFQEMGMELL